MKRIYTIIPVRNFKNETLGCLKGLVKAKARGYENKILIIDNASTDGSAQEINKEFPSVQIIINKENRGFAPAINQGLRKALKDSQMHFVLLLNNDTRVPPDFLQKLVSTAMSDKAIGITAPALRHYQKETLYYGMEGKLDLKLAVAGHRNIKTIKSKKIVAAQFVSGCCMLIKREVLEKVGLMDERFFLYLDDVDYCLTVQKAGYRTVLDPGVVIDHKVSASFGKQPLFKLPHSFKSNIIFIVKWTPLIYKPLAILRCLYFYPSLAVLWSLNN